MEIGLQALNRDGLNLGALTPFPLRADDKPRAVWPEGLTHLPAAPLVLDGEEEPVIDPVRESDNKDRYYHRKYGDTL